MRRILSICILLLVLTQSGNAQGTGMWTPYLSYYNTTAVAETNNNVFALANGSLYSYGKEDQSVKFYSRETGLSDNNITKMGYNADVNTLLLFYSNGNIDLFGEKGVYNLPYLLNSTNVQSKEINTIYFNKEYAYLSMNFGIMVVNMKKNEISETYKLNDTIFSTCIKDKMMYAATPKGICIASIDDNLLDSNNWKTLSLNTNLFEDAMVRKIDVFQNMLCLYVKGKGVYYLDTNQTVQPLYMDSNIKNMVVENGKLFAYANTTSYICYSLTQKINVSTGTINDISCQNNSDMYWVAAGASGLRGMKRKDTTNQMEVVVSDLISLEDSPKRNWAVYMTHQQGKLLVAGGDRWANRSFRSGTCMIYENGKWNNFDEGKIQKQTGLEFMDVTSVVVDPQNPTHYFASTWGEGVFEFEDDKAPILHNLKNSTLALTNLKKDNPSDYEKNHYVRVDGLCYDKKGNLWMTNTAMNSCINVYTKDKAWVALTDSKYSRLYDQALVDKILITSKGYKWVNILRETPAIVVFDDKGTIDDTSDDIVNTFTTFRTAKGEDIAASGYYCVTEDKNGTIWIGTNRGPIICPVPNRAVEDPDQIYCTRITRTNADDVPVYFLDNMKVTAIAVDGGNRKWLGTEGNGVFLVSEDGMETIENFTTENSPLLSNVIESIAIDNATGEVFFGTDKGIISYMGGASEGKEDYSDIYAYPNPVRPDYTGPITITGLMTDSNVKITDINGNLIYQAKSLGGQLTWNGRNRGGNRVGSGVYLVLASTPEGKESVVTKIMVIK